MSKKDKKAKAPTPKNLPHNETVKTDLSFHELIKLAVSTPIKDSKVNKNK